MAVKSGLDSLLLQGLQSRSALIVLQEMEIYQLELMQDSEFPFPPS